jgi:hypothetical protein
MSLAGRLRGHHFPALPYCRLLRDFARTQYENANRIELSSASFIVGWLRNVVFLEHISQRK